MILYSNQVVKSHTPFAFKELVPQVAAFCCNLAINTKKPLQPKKSICNEESKELVGDVLGSSLSRAILQNMSSAMAQHGDTTAEH